MDDFNTSWPSYTSPAVKRGMLAGTTIGTSALLAWGEARFGAAHPSWVKPAGIDIDLLAGGLLTLGAFAMPDMLGAEGTEFVLAAGTGALSLSAAKYAAKYGSKGAAAAGNSAPATGALPPRSFHVSAGDLSAMAAARKQW